jgi:RNA polymerase sigma-70 factor (ECF subfamily)
MARGAAGFTSGRAVRDLDGEFSWLFRAEYDHVVRTVYLIVRDRGRAEEISQDAFAELYSRWAKISRYERPDAWVRRVAIRMAVRAKRRERMRGSREHDASPSLDEERPVDLDLVRAVASLPPMQRAAVVLFYFEDRPVAEIADILGCSEGSAKRHLFRARARLAERIGTEMADES